MKSRWYLDSAVVFFLTLAFNLYAAPFDPSAADYSGNKGTTIYVSKLGDNSDGSSWEKAFHTIQAALLAVPDDQGGHQIIVRPDTYAEACLYPVQKGAEGAYNLLIGDSAGSLGSGARGWVIIDTSCPGVAVRPDYQGTYRIIESDLPESGFKSIDYWSTVLVGPGPAKDQSAGTAEETFSSLSWDRWILRNLYTSGSDGGFFWDINIHARDGKGGYLSDIYDPAAAGKGFTVIVEDCVSIGRAFGGGVAYPVVRPDEPSVFRRSYFLALDHVGDSAGVLVGGWETTMPEHPHLILEDCTLVHPVSPLATSFANRCARVTLIDCRLISLMFTQVEMGGDQTAKGIIRTIHDRADGRLHVDLEDCILAGYSVFTPSLASEHFSYRTKGEVLAYIHYRRPLPKGFSRLGLWPVELFNRIAPPMVPRQ